MPFTRGRLIVVFGCGGDRDRGKRPEMGAIAEQGADCAIVTSDNPRTEDPERILDDIEAGMRGAKHERIDDRRAAIARAIDMAEDGDVVLLAGKGHETYQIRGTTSFPFDEKEIVREMTAESRMSAGFWTLDRVADALERTRRDRCSASRLGVSVSGITTDTRTIGPGDLFVALSGESSTRTTISPTRFAKARRRSSCRSAEARLRSAFRSSRCATRSSRSARSRGTGGGRGARRSSASWAATERRARRSCSAPRSVGSSRCTRRPGISTIASACR